MNDYEVLKDFLGLRVGQITQFREEEAEKYVNLGCIKLVKITPQITTKKAK
jgi:hypothetical protein